MAAPAAVTRPASLGGDGRLAGIDLARGLAVLGMLAAHLLDTYPFDWADPASWLDVVNGRSSILFATLAGVSLALMTRRAPEDRSVRGVLRGRIAVRAVIIWAVGIALIATAVPVYVILPAYGILFLLALPLIAWRARALWILAAALAVVMPFVQPFIAGAFFGRGSSSGETEALIGWEYPFTLWSTFLVAGMALGRSDLRRLRTQLLVLAAGTALAVVAYGADAIARLQPVSDETPTGPFAFVLAVWTAEAHSGGALEVWGSGGFALAVIAACLLVCRTPIRTVLFPLRAVGSMPLTAYAGQIVAWAIAATVLLGDPSDLWGFRALQPFGWFVAITIVFCTVWALTLGRGPLERLLRAISHWIVRPITAESPDRLNG